MWRIVRQMITLLGAMTHVLISADLHLAIQVKQNGTWIGMRSILALTAPLLQKLKE
jgi:hypothetical protein